MGNDGELSFALGLQAGGFVSAMASAEQKLGSFLGAAAKISGITAISEAMLAGLRHTADAVTGVMDAFSRGSELQRLHQRTGESVNDLFLLQKGFKAVGLDAGEVGQMILRMQKSLTGLSDVGEDTSSVFSMLGLNMSELQKSNAPQQIEAIAKAFQGLNRDQAAGFAGKLFGRESTGNFLQLARDSADFSKALRDNAQAAEQMARNASAFNRIETDLGKLKGKSQNLFAGIAEGIAPAVEKVLNYLNKIDLSGIGKTLGNILSGIVGALEKGKLTDLIYLAVYTGFEMAVAGVPALFAKLGETLLKVFETPLNYIQAAMEYVIEHIMATITTLHLNKVFGTTELKPENMPTWDQIVKDQQKSGPRFNVGTGEYGMGDISKATEAAWAEAKGKMADFAGAFMSELNKYSTKPGAVPGSEKPGLGNLLGNLSEMFKATSAESMGFHFGNGGPSLLQDHARQTAQNTARIATAMESFLQYAQASGHGVFANRN